MIDLRTHIQSAVSIAQPELEDVIRRFESRSIRKGAYLSREGQLMDRFYFICAGALRVYLNHEERQITAWLSFENNWLADIASIRTGKPSVYSIQAIEDTEVVSIKASEMNLLYDAYPKWQEFGRKLWEQAFLEVVDAMLSHQTMTAEERYVRFMGQSNILQRVPLKQLSSFLGITPTSLSRLRRHLK